MFGKKKKNKKSEGDRKKNKEGDQKSWHQDLHPETKKGILAVFVFILAVLFILSYLGKGGSAGNYLYRAFNFLLGKGYFFAPIVFVLIGFSLIYSAKRRILGATFLGGILFLVSSLVFMDLLFEGKSGGFIGSLLGSPLLKFFDFWASIVIAIGLFLVSFLLMFNMPIFKQKEAKEKMDDEEQDKIEEKNGQSVKDIEHDAQNSGEFSGGAGGAMKTILDSINTTIKNALDGRREESLANEYNASRATIDSEFSPKDSAKKDDLISVRKASKKFNYKKPPIDLLRGDIGKPTSGDIRANANIIKRTFENFGIDVEMGEVSIGPTVTQYTLRPAEGVKIAKIVALHNDISLALAAHPIRIEAPIPGRSLVGIEVPNRSVALVGLRSLLEHDIFKGAASPLLFALGRDVTGTPVFADLAKMPHLLISGSTGSGKSVCAHTILTSFLYRNPPEVLKFIIVDPKRVELSVYNDIPHLLTPVITDPKKTIQALRWATKEMDRRYDMLSVYQTRDIISYNELIAKKGEEEPLPYIVIMIDELADLMAVYPREVEGAIIRLAQMARAVGIHLIVSTQRPSVDVITGLIKANITSRIAFQVASQIDSRTVLDMTGAEKLLGNGDMLFLAGDSAKPRRIQGSFISENEVKRVVGFLREEVEAPEYEESIFEAKVEDSSLESDEFSEGSDPLYEEAKNLVIRVQKASASYLQRRFRIGYARAARLLDLMEEQGIVGPADGAKAREIFVSTSIDNIPEDENIEES